MIRRPPRSTQSRSSAASDVYKRQTYADYLGENGFTVDLRTVNDLEPIRQRFGIPEGLSLIHISEPTRLLSTSYAVFCLKKKKHNTRSHTHLLSLFLGDIHNRL